MDSSKSSTSAWPSSLFPAGRAQINSLRSNCRPSQARFWERWNTCRRSRLSAVRRIFGRTSFHSAWCCMRWSPAGAPFRETQPRRRLLPFFASRPIPSGCGTPTLPLRCVGRSRGAWLRSPINVTSRPGIWRASLQPYATASPTSRRSRLRPGQPIFPCSGPALWGGRKM